MDTIELKLPDDFNANDPTGTASVIAVRAEYEKLKDTRGEVRARQIISPWLEEVNMSIEDFENMLKNQKILHSSNPTLLIRLHNIDMEKLFEEYNDKILDKTGISRSNDDD